MFNNYIKNLSSFDLGDIRAYYLLDKETGQVGLSIIPISANNDIVKQRDLLPENVELANFIEKDIRANVVDSLIQLKCVGDDYPGGFSQGRTLRNSETVKKLKYNGQEVSEKEDKFEIVTSFVCENRFECKHILNWFRDEPVLRVRTSFENISNKSELLEMISSFSLGGISPFDEADSSRKLKFHRYRSNWSAEAKPEALMLEDMHMERSWIGHGVTCERFGQVGSMPVRAFFPFAAVEDIDKNIFWGAQLAIPGSWQIELYKRDDKTAMSGGLADREFGHWLKEVPPGKSFITPEAVISVCGGNLEKLTQRLIKAQQRPLKNMPEKEKELPVIFNEWCTSWGNPSHENLEEIADKIKDTGIKYLVIDAGWYKTDGVDWDNSQGDWNPYDKFYPQGLKAAANAIKQRGLIPGLWFEFEAVGKNSKAKSQTDHLLKRDGKVIVSGERMFWDFRDDYTIDYLNKKVIKLLKDCGFGYLKIDYNETLGIGVDGAESFGEGLREHLSGVQKFIKSIRREIPEITIEICSSGGHRLEPSMMSICSMGSFSDAHETVEIPIIAANLQKMILPRQLQVWSVLRKTDYVKRIVYSLAATFLGRMCLSGDIHEIKEQQWQKVLEGISFYDDVKHIIKDGESFKFEPKIKSFRYPEGWQAVLRLSLDKKEGLIVIHKFRNAEKNIEFIMPEEGMKIEKTFSSNNVDYSIKNEKFTCKLHEDFSACVLHLKK